MQSSSDNDSHDEYSLLIILLFSSIGFAEYANVYMSLCMGEFMKDLYFNIYGYKL
jgi:hypothetical protein